MLEKPLLIGPSRKAFLGKILGDLPVQKRLEGTAASVAISIIKGAHIVRVHDVKEMAMIAKVADAIKQQRINLILKTAVEPQPTAGASKRERKVKSSSHQIKCFSRLVKAFGSISFRISWRTLRLCANNCLF